MKRIFLFVESLLLMCQFAYSQIGSARIYLHDSTVSHISVNMISKEIILDSQGKGISYHIIDSLSTPDSSIANQIQGLFPNVQTTNRDKEYIVNFSLINPPKIISVQKKDSLQAKQMVLVKLLNGQSFEGEFISSNDSAATYRSNLGSITINKSMIFSLQPVDSSSRSKTKHTSPTRVALKFCLDLAGSHKASAMGQSASVDVNTGISIGLEVEKAEKSIFNYAVGMMYLIPREQKVSGSGNFNFLPIYAAAKIRLSMEEESIIPVLIGNIGYDVLFNGDQNYKGPFRLSGGLYIAGGLRLEIQKIFFLEALYKSFGGSAKYSIDGTDINVDINYTTVSLAFGLLL